MKQCTKCNETLPYIAFHKDRATKDGHYPSCIKCNRHKRSDKDKKAAYDKERRSRLEWYKLSRQHKVSEKTLKQLHEAQNGLCAICSLPETELHGATQKSMRLSLDHDHNTLKVRGFLCGKHNKALGLFKDNIEHLEAAIAYLKSHNRT